MVGVTGDEEEVNAGMPRTEGINGFIAIDEKIDFSQKSFDSAEETRKRICRTSAYRVIFDLPRYGIVDSCLTAVLRLNTHAKPY